MFGRTHFVHKRKKCFFIPFLLHRQASGERVIVNTYLFEMKRKKVNKKNWVKMRTVLQSLCCLLILCLSILFAFAHFAFVPKMTWNMCGNSILCAAKFNIFHHKFIRAAFFSVSLLRWLGLLTWHVNDERWRLIPCAYKLLCFVICRWWFL